MKNKEKKCKSILANGKKFVKIIAIFNNILGSFFVLDVQIFHPQTKDK